LSGMSRFSIQSCRVVRDMDLGYCQKHYSFLLPTLEFTSYPRGSHGRLVCLCLPRKQLQHRLCA
jgi:hypothetical protein